jgi:phenylacetate-CoA ligase
MHISAEHVIVEIVDRQGNVLPPGEAGEVVITHTATGEFPFVRYRTGDVAVLDDGQCACGRGLPLLRDIEGRTTDFVVAADGTVMHGLALIYVLRDQPGIDAFKIIQESMSLLRVQVVAGQGLSETTRQAITGGLAQRMGEGVTIQVEQVEEIPRERSGKYRYVVSKVAAP